MAVSSLGPWGRMSRKPVAFAFVLLFAGIGGSLIAFSRAATLATLSITPVTADASVGSTFTATITEDSGTTPVNAVQPEIDFDKTKLQIASIDYTAGAFPAQAEQTITDGHVTMARGAFSALTGPQTVGVITFKALATGSAAVSFSTNSQLLQLSDSTNILTTRQGATYNLKDTTPPTAPGVAMSAGNTATSINLVWLAAVDNVGVANYNVYRNGTKIGTATGLTYSDTGLKPNNTYSYTITATDASGNESPASTAVSLTTPPDTTAPSIVTGLTQSSVTVQTAKMAWSAATDDVGVSSYIIYRNGTQIGTSTVLNYTDSNLTPDTNYIYTIVAVDAAGNKSAASVAVTMHTKADTTAPSVPAGVTGVVSGTNSVTVTWSASTDNVGVAQYTVYRNDVSIGTTASTTFSDTSLTLGNTYTYSVTATDTAGNTSAKATVASVTLNLKPGDVNSDTKVDLKDLSILLTNWNKSSGQSWATGDLNQDGVVNLYDLSSLLKNWNT